MAQITIYADDSVWYKERNRKYIEPILGVGKWKYGNRLYGIDSVIRFPDTFAPLLQQAKMNSCKLVFTASSGIDRLINVNFCLVRPNPSEEDIQQLMQHGKSTWETIGFIESGVRQNEDALLEITDKNIASRILTLGLILFTNEGNAGDSFLYSSRAAVPTNAPRLIIDYSSDDTPPNTEIVSPKTGIVDGSKPVTFRWSYMQDVSIPQSNYDLQYTTDNGAHWSIVADKIASKSTSHTLPEYTLPNGKIEWRVRVWSKGTIASEWASTAIVVQAGPRVPSISSVGSTPRPTIQWQSADQQSFQVQAGNVYDSGSVFGTDKRFQIPEFLPNGTLQVRLRIQNGLGLWSNWAVFEASVQNQYDTEQYSIFLKSRTEGPSLELSWDGAGEYKEFYLYRDGKVIAVLPGGTSAYLDHMACQKSDYLVRGVLPINDYYVMSRRLTSGPSIANAVLSGVDHIKWIALAYGSGGPPTRETSRERQVAYFHYDGRENPVSQVSEFVDAARSFEFSVTREEYKQLEALVGRLVVYKDMYGCRTIGILNGLSGMERKKRIDAGFTITEVDYHEL